VINRQLAQVASKIVTAAPAAPSGPLLPRATHKAMTGQAGGDYLCPLTQAVLAYSAGNTYAQHQRKPSGESETG